MFYSEFYCKALEDSPDYGVPNKELLTPGLFVVCFHEKLWHRVEIISLDIKKTDENDGSLGPAYNVRLSYIYLLLFVTGYASHVLTLPYTYKNLSYLLLYN